MRRCCNKSLRWFCGVWVAVAVLFCAGPAGSALANEKAVWDIWQKIEANPEDLSGVIRDCEALKSGPPNVLSPVTDGFLAWCYFKTGRMNDGARILMALEKSRTTDIQRAASDMARAWLSRIDVKLVELALQMHYKKHMAFPEQLNDALSVYGAQVKAPRTDRWGRQWDYALVGFKFLKNVPKDQKYALKSSMLGEESNFEEALKFPYAGGIKLVPMKMGISTPGKESVYFTVEGDKDNKPILVEVGSKKSGVTLAHTGKNVLVLTDGNHWKLVARPQR